MPFGLQVMAKQKDDHELFRFSKEIEGLNG